MPLGKSISTGVKLTNRLVIIGQSRSQPSGLGADDGIAARIEIGLTVENLQADEVFLDLVALACQGFPDRELQEAAVTGSVAEDRRLQDSL